MSPLIGVAIGSFYTGVIGDKIVLKMARRNQGEQSSELCMCETQADSYFALF